MFVFGGRHERHQISQIRDCHLERVGSLEFEFWDGACATSSLDQVVLCFVKADNNDECYVSSAPSGPYETIQRSIYSHMSTRIASSDGAFTPRLFFKFTHIEYILAIGDSSHANAELLDTSAWSWSTTVAYPFHSNVYQAPVIHQDAYFYIFGGYEYNRENSEPGISTIARFSVEQREWKKIGDLKVKREGMRNQLF